MHGSKSGSLPSRQAVWVGERKKPHASVGGSGFLAEALQGDICCMMIRGAYQPAEVAWLGQTVAFVRTWDFARNAPTLGSEGLASLSQDTQVRWMALRPS